MKPKVLSNAAGGGGIPSGNLRYPATQVDSNTDYVKIKFHEYNPPFSTGGFSNSGLSGYNRSISELGPQIGGDVFLYMPQDISAQYGGHFGLSTFIFYIFKVIDYAFDFTTN